VAKLVQAILPTTSKDLIQTDLFLNAQKCTIEKQIIQKIVNQLQALAALSHATPKEAIENFIASFKQRYEQQTIPLCQALDTETGIGYSHFSGAITDPLPLIKDIASNQQKQNSTQTISWGKLQQFQLEKYLHCLQHQNTHIEITDDDLAALTTYPPPRFPYSMYVMGTLLNTPGNNATANENNESFNFLFKNMGGPSAANLLGRFCHGSPLLTKKLQQYLEEEQANFPDAILAEIVHLPAARIGNILMRPLLRNYEIPYLAQSGVAHTHQIPVTDLYVSIKQNTVVLTSKKLGKQVIPRMSTAHNTNKSTLPIYQFLCDVQWQEHPSSFYWHWGVLNTKSYLPRVTYKNIILKRAQWILQKKDHQEIVKNKQLNLVDYFSVVKEKLRMPQYVLLAEGDNELLLDLNHKACLDIVSDNLLKKESITLLEFLELPENCLVVNEKKESFTNEIIIPLKASTNILPINMPTQKHRMEHRPIQRNYSTGSQWLYAKIYCGSTTAENILTNTIKPLIELLTANHTIEKWFFIRYTDEKGNHLRVRFYHATDTNFWQPILKHLKEKIQPYIDSSLVHTLQTDTYHQEVERYGHATINLSETIFYYDSEAVLHFINLLGDDQNEQYRWLLALRGIDMLLNDFEYTLTEKSILLDSLQESSTEEFGKSQELVHQLNDSYRSKKNLIADILTPAKDVAGGVEEAVAIFAHRSKNIQPIAQQIKELLQPTHEATLSLDSLLANYIHLFLNRLFISNQRKHELVIYHFLAKYYQSQKAMQR
jgi:lantibiotic biosynthesis protein